MCIRDSTDPQVPTFQSADAWRSRLAGFTPAPWQPAPTELTRAAEIVAALPAFDTLWFSDGLDYPGRDELLAALQSKGAVEVHQSAGNVIGIAPAVYQDGAIDLTLRRAAPGPERAAVVQAHGRDPAGNARVLATANATFEAGATEASTSLSLPAEMRARLTSFDLSLIHI